LGNKEKEKRGCSINTIGTAYISMSFQSFPDGLKRMISGYSSIISLAIASPVGSASNPQ
jgi:hypothetical protein